MSREGKRSLALMAAHPKASTPRDLEIHLAYEVDWLVYSARRFATARSKEAVAFQDSVFVHARNLLEFTKASKPAHGWWIADHGPGPRPRASARHPDLTRFPTANVTHPGPTRER